VRLEKGDRVTCREVPCAGRPMTGTVLHVGWKTEVELDEEPLPGLGRTFVLRRATMDRLEDGSAVTATTHQ